jgi:ureidoglycolate hydrolase
MLQPVFSKDYCECMEKKSNNGRLRLEKYCQNNYQNVVSAWNFQTKHLAQILMCLKRLELHPLICQQLI